MKRVGFFWYLTNEDGDLTKSRKKVVSLQKKSNEINT
jgi:hypothetical protein